MTPQNMKTYTVEQIEYYLKGWISTESNPEVRYALANGLANLRDGEEGIEPTTDNRPITVRQLAAISLRVPASGSPMIDAMIRRYHARRANRQEERMRTTP
jgi:hypothetical protein